MFRARVQTRIALREIDQQILQIEETMANPSTDRTLLAQNLERARQYRTEVANNRIGALTFTLLSIGLPCIAALFFGHGFETIMRSRLARRVRLEAGARERELVELVREETRFREHVATLRESLAPGGSLEAEREAARHRGLAAYVAGYHQGSREYRAECDSSSHYAEIRRQAIRSIRSGVMEVQA
jgi:hypothetical protein